MKKAICVILITMLTFALISCDSEYKKITYKTYEKTLAGYGKITEINRNSDGNETFETCEYTYNDDGTIKTKTTYSTYRPEPVEEVYVYENDGYSVVRQEESSDGLVVNVYEAKYDENGNLLRAVYRYPRGREYLRDEYAYDERGNVISYKWKEYENRGYVEYTYDSADNLLSETKYDADGIFKYKTEYGYNKYGDQVYYAYYKDSEDNGTKHYYEYIYDDNDNLIMKSKDGKTIVYTYDEQGNLILEKKDDTNIGYTYDERGNLILVEEYYYYNAARLSVGNDFSEGYNLVEKTEYTYNEKDQMTAEIHDDYKIEYSYDEQGNVVCEKKYWRIYHTEETYELAEKTEYTYDENKNILTTKRYKGTELIYDYSCIYYENGGKKKIETTKNEDGSAYTREYELIYENPVYFAKEKK